MDSQQPTQEPQNHRPSAGKGFGNPSASLLVVEDSDEDFEALNRMLDKASVSNPIYRCIDGDEALDYLNREGVYQNPVSAPRPSLVLLDLNLPGTDGREVLEHIKRTPSLRRIPVVVLSTSSNPKDIQNCYDHGVNSYLVKPMSLTRFRQMVQTLLDYWLNIAMLPDSDQEASSQETSSMNKRWGDATASPWA